MDAEESLQNAGHPGEVYRGGGADTLNLEQATVEDSFITDEFGTWLRTHAPVRDRNGQLVGAVVVEAPEGWVQSKMRPISLSGLLALALSFGLTLPAVIFVSRRVTRPLTRLRVALDAIGEGNFETRLTMKSGYEFDAVAKTINTMAEGLAERERVKGAFARYVSHQVYESILHSSSAVIRGGRRMISVLFCDIRGFTTISESLPPEKVVQLLNEYFEAMVEVVFRNSGTLDKFIGDGLMVIFGAPQDDPKQEEHALRAAIEMQAELRKLAAKWKAEGLNAQHRDRDQLRTRDCRQRRLFAAHGLHRYRRHSQPCIAPRSNNEGTRRWNPDQRVYLQRAARLFPLPPHGGYRFGAAVSRCSLSVEENQLGSAEATASPQDTISAL